MIWSSDKPFLIICVNLQRIDEIFKELLVFDYL